LIPEKGIRNTDWGRIFPSLKSVAEAPNRVADADTRNDGNASYNGTVLKIDCGTAEGVFRAVCGSRDYCDRIYHMSSVYKENDIALQSAKNFLKSIP